MYANIPTRGGANDELQKQVHTTWLEVARVAGVDLSAFDPDASLPQRIAWAKSVGLEIGTALARYSTKDQKSTTVQTLDCVRYAAGKQIYIPPEFVCVDEGVSGRKSARAGVERMQLILKHKLAKVLLVYKLSRLFRSAYKALRYINEEIVEEGLRAIAITQGIDTADEKMWKAMMALHGIMDEMLLSTIGDHVRSSQQDLFRNGFTTGALPVGYYAKEVPGAPKTNRGRVRTMPAVSPDVAKLVVQHFEWIRDGLPIREGWRRWVRADGARDPRSKIGHMTYNSYRRMLSNIRLTGRWAFGAKRNRWLCKSDHLVQQPGPANEIISVQCEELRVVSDELFFAVQAKLTALKTGARTAKRRRSPQLWDLVTDCFYCDECQERFYQAGAKGEAMRCKISDLCTCKAIVRRRDAVIAVCEKLNELVQGDSELIKQIEEEITVLQSSDDSGIEQNLARVSDRINSLSRKNDDLFELAGEGDDDARRQIKNKIRSVREERSSLQLERARLETLLNCRRHIPSASDIRKVLADVTQLLVDAAAGSLGEDVVYQAAETFRLLVGERITVVVELRPGRKRANVRGVFNPKVLRSIGQMVNIDVKSDADPKVSVWLRKPPLRDQLAELVYQLIGVQGHSYRSAAKELQRLGYNVNSGVVHQIRRRYFEMKGIPVPKLPYNNGKDRDAA